MKKFFTSYWFIYIMSLIIAGVIAFLLCRFLPMNDYYTLHNDLIAMDWLIVGMVYTLVLVIVLNLIFYVKKMFS